MALFDPSMARVEKAAQDAAKLRKILDARKPGYTGTELIVLDELDAYESCREPQDPSYQALLDEVPTPMWLALDKRRGAPRPRLVTEPSSLVRGSNRIPPLDIPGRLSRMLGRKS